VALLVFLSAATGAGIVPADLRPGVAHRRALDLDAVHEHPARPVLLETGALAVVDVDGIWMLDANSGSLVLTLKDGPVVSFPVTDVKVFIGWLHTIGAGVVEFDGVKLTTVEPKKWPDGSFPRP